MINLILFKKISGFGDLDWGTRNFPDILQSVDVPAWSNQECQDLYVEEVIHPFHLCAGARKFHSKI